MRERAVGHGHLEELAQRLPSFADLPHEQTLGRDRVLDLLVVGDHLLHHLLRLAAGREGRALSPQQVVDEQQVAPPAEVDLAPGS